jgi:L,D-transpeptidase YcbB
MVPRKFDVLAFGAVFLRIAVCIVPVMSGANFANAAAAPGSRETRSPGSVERPPVELALQAKIESLPDRPPDGQPAHVTRPAERDAIRVFYAERGNRPVWVDTAGPTRAAARLIAEFARAAEWGLNASDFRLGATSVPMTQGQWSVSETAAAEYEISALVLKYARQARGGRIPEPDRVLSSYLDRRPVLAEPLSVLSSVAASAAPDAALRAFHPQHEQFQRLHDLYVKLNTEAERGRVAELPLKGPHLVPGITHADVAILRRRLGTVAGDGNLETYDPDLVAAVKKFQESASLDDDSIIGPATRKALNTGGGNHLKTIAANMEQWRWMPDDLGATHLFVNVPAFSISLMKNGVSTLEERVIAGKSTTQTPIFSKQLTAIVLSPLWYLPDSIKLEKLLAAQRSGTPIEDEGYLVKRNGHAVDSGSVDWNAANLKEYSIYQPAGESNALGDVKFLFPNKHSVYLHDTPNKSLFNASERLFSHGCIRLRNPLALAQRLLDTDKGSGVWNVKETVRKGEGNTQVMLDAPIPIHVAYFTMWIGNDGVPQYYGDPYGHEERITLALEQKWDAIDKGADHLAAVDTRQLKSVDVQEPAKSKVAARPSPRPATSRQIAAAEPAPVPGRRARSYDPPSGLTKTAQASAPKFFAKSRENGGVGEMIRSALQH